MESVNKVCSILDIRYPLIQAAMNWITDASMVAAVSNAGGMGTLGPNAGVREPSSDPIEVAERTRREIKKIKELTDKTFGVNLILPNEGQEGADAFSQAILRVLFEEKVPCIVTIGQVNSPLFNEIKNHDCILIHREYNPTPKAAKAAEAAGVDMVIATGYDEGGVFPHHPVGTFSIVPVIADAVSIPVLATGGINDIRGVRAAMTLGAQGVYVGTRFIVSNECPASDATKQEIIRSKAADMITLTSYRSTPDKAAQRLLHLLDTGTSREVVDEQIRKGGGLRPGMLEGNLHEGIVSVNTAIDLITEVKSCETIVKELMDDYITH